MGGIFYHNQRAMGKVSVSLYDNDDTLFIVVSTAYQRFMWQLSICSVFIWAAWFAFFRDLKVIGFG